MEAEYWIKPDSSAIRADRRDGKGDSHEIVVYETLRKRFFIDLRRGRFADMATMLTGKGDPTLLRTEINDIADTYEKDRRITPEEADDFPQTLADEIGWSRDLLSLMLGHRDDDLRDYAMRHWSWIRLSQNNVQVWALTHHTLAVLEEGLRRLHAGISECFTIEVKPTQDVYFDVPRYVLAEATLKDLKPYKTRRSPVPYSEPQA
jgi:hypothetical protein